MVIVRRVVSSNFIKTVLFDNGVPSLSDKFPSIVISFVVSGSGGANWFEGVYVDSFNGLSMFNMLVSLLTTLVTILLFEPLKY